MLKKDVILIVGGAGYIGSHVNKRLKQQGYKTVIFDNLSLGHIEFTKENEFYRGDLSSTDSLIDCFNKFNIKAVMHFAALSQVGESVKEPERYYQNNVVNTINLLHVMKLFNVKYFILSSTAAVYSQSEAMPLTEDSLVKPSNPYGNTKAMIESILEDYSNIYSFYYISLRYFNACGADESCEIGEWHDPETHLIPLTLDVALDNRKSISIFGADYDTSDGTAVRDYIHVNDLADAHINALKYLILNKKNDIFNLGSGKGYSVKEVINMVEYVTKRKINKIVEERRIGDPSILIANSTKAKEVLRWVPQYSLNDIVNSAWNWHKKQFKNNSKEMR